MTKESNVPQADAGEPLTVPEAQENPTSPEQGAQDAPKAPPATPEAKEEPQAQGESEQSQDWRDRWAGDDEKFRKHLDIFSTEADAAKSYMELRKLNSKKREIPTLGEDATEEQVAQYRKDMGVPDSHEGYEITAEFSDADKPLVDMYLQEMNLDHATPAEANKALNAYSRIQQRIQEQVQQSTREALQQQEKELRVKFGGDYENNLNLNRNFLIKDMGSDAAALLFGGELSDGRKVGGGMDADGNPLKFHPELHSLFNRIARDEGFGDTTPYGNEQAANRIEQDIAKIENVMRNDENRYWKDEKMQAEYADLLKKRKRMSQKNT